MAEEKYESREMNLTKHYPWLELFRGFQVAIDPRKLLLAAAGIFAMSLGWMMLSMLFDSLKSKPTWDKGQQRSENKDAEWARYRVELDEWNFFHQYAGWRDSEECIEVGDVADNREEYDKIKKEVEDYEAVVKHNTKVTNDGSGELKPIPKPSPKAELVVAKVRKPTGYLNAWPWAENRGPNPYMMVTGQAEKPWEKGGFPGWFLTTEVPVLLEPLFKFLRPVILFLHPRADFSTRLYALSVILWTLAVWGLFGGAITRMASVELTRREKVGIVDALKFARKRFLSYFTAPLFPLIFVAILVLILIVFGVIHLIPWLGDVVSGIIWPITIILGILMAIVLVGLVGWPMMSATISTEGTDSWEAVSRSYSYIFQAPWHYLWYTVVAICYGAVIVFFVGFMGSFAVYLGRWGFSQTPFVKKASREPSFLFVWAPESFGWRELLLTGGTSYGEQLVGDDGKINQRAYDRYVGKEDDETKKADEEKKIHDYRMNRNSFFPYVGAGLVSFWLYLFFMAIIGFGYSYFWTSSTIIYLLMRRKVDDAELDEVYLEEEEHDTFFTPPTRNTTPSPSAPAPAPANPSLQMVDAPTLRVSPPPPPNTPPGGSTSSPPSSSSSPPASSSSSPPSSASSFGGGTSNSPPSSTPASESSGGSSSSKSSDSAKSSDQPPPNGEGGSSKS